MLLSGNPAGRGVILSGQTTYDGRICAPITVRVEGKTSRLRVTTRRHIAQPFKDAMLPPVFATR